MSEILARRWFGGQNVNMVLKTGSVQITKSFIT